MTQDRVRIVPLTLPVANRLVERLHRHHPPMPPGFAWFAVGAVVNGQLCGAAVAGRPTNRNNDDGGTVEVLRVASDGTANSCSALLGACQRAAKAMGAWRVMTYTLDHESGSSLKAVGWVNEKSGIRSYWTTPTVGRSPGVNRTHSSSTKVRWVAYFSDGPIEFVNPYAAPLSGDAQGGLFGEQPA